MSAPYGDAMGTRVLGAAAVAGVSPLLVGCLLIGDPPPDPAVAPIEVVAKVDSCLLNRDSVAAGTHDTAVIIEQGTGRVRLLRDDRLVQELFSGPTPTPLTLTSGDYVVECVVDGRRSTAALTVT